MHSLFKRIKGEINNKYLKFLNENKKCVIDIVLFDAAPYFTRPLYGFFFGLDKSSLNANEGKLLSLIEAIRYKFDSERSEGHTLFSVVQFYSNESPSKNASEFPKILKTEVLYAKECKPINVYLEKEGLTIKHGLNENNYYERINNDKIIIENKKDSFILDKMLINMDLTHYVKLAVLESILFKTDAVFIMPKIAFFPNAVANYNDLRWKAVIIMYLNETPIIEKFQNVAESILFDILSILVQQHQVRSSVTAIMARNKSHIHGSHIEHGLRNRMSTFEAHIIERLEKSTGLCKRLQEISKIKLQKSEFINLDQKKFVFLMIIKDESQKRLSFYRQRQDDLSARMATEWPQWGCSLDFYTHIILPIKKNPLVLHFINLSDDYSLKDIEIKFGYYKKDAHETLTWVKEFIGFSKQKEKEEEADLVDFALHLLTNNTDVNIDGNSLSEYFNGCKFQLNNRLPFLVSLRDADIGAQAFFALFEGIIRNASKHGQDNNNGHRFKIKIVGCDTWEQVNSLVDFEEENYQPKNHGKYKYILISVGRDLTKEDGGIRKIGEAPLIKALRSMIGNGIIDDTGKIVPGNWGIKEMKICSAFVAGEPIATTQDKAPDYFHIGKSRENKIWEDGKERICYVVRFNKPRIALAVVPNNKKPQDPLAKVWEGARFVDCPTDIFAGEIDYDFLYVDNSLKKDVCNLIEMNNAALPQRIVYGDMDFKSPVLNNALEFGYQLYDEFFEQQQYIMVPHQKQEINLRIYFDDDELASSWKDIAKGPIKLKSREIKIDFIMKNSPDWRSSKYLEGYQLCLCRHNKIDVFEKKRVAMLNNELSYYPYYVQHVSASDQFFSFLMSIQPKEDKDFSQFLIRQIIEATLLNVLIIDERISESLYLLKSPDEPEILMVEKLYWMGISVVKSLWVEGENKSIWETPTEKAKTKNDSSQGQIDRLAKFIFNEDGGIETKEINGLPIHVLFIHATRLNEIYDKLKGRLKNKEEIINKIKINGKIPYVIVHSGRGKTEGDIPDNAPFVEYSTLERYVLSEPSKFYLIQIALSAKGEKK